MKKKTGSKKSKSGVLDESMELDPDNIDDMQGDEEPPFDVLESSSSEDDDVGCDPDGESEIHLKTSGIPKSKRRNPVSSEDKLDAALKKAARLNKARLEIKQEVSFKPHEFDQIKFKAPKFTNVDTFMVFYQYFIQEFLNLRVFTPLLAANELQLPFVERSAIAEFEDRLELEADLLRNIDEYRFKEAQSLDPSVNLLTSAVSKDYRRVPVHKIIPGYAIPDIHIQTHLRCCKPVSTYLTMDNRELVTYTQICYNNIRIHQAEYLYQVILHAATPTNGKDVSPALRIMTEHASHGCFHPAMYNLHNTYFPMMNLHFDFSKESFHDTITMKSGDTIESLSTQLLSKRNIYMTRNNGVDVDEKLAVAGVVKGLASAGTPIMDSVARKCLEILNRHAPGTITATKLLEFAKQEYNRIEVNKGIF